MMMTEVCVVVVARMDCDMTITCQRLAAVAVMKTMIVARPHADMTAQHAAWLVSFEMASALILQVHDHDSDVITTALVLSTLGKAERRHVGHCARAAAPSCAAVLAVHLVSGTSSKQAGILQQQQAYQSTRCAKVWGKSRICANHGQLRAPYHSNISQRPCSWNAEMRCNDHYKHRTTATSTHNQPICVRIPHLTLHLDPQPITS